MIKMKLSLKFLVLSLTGFFIIVSTLYSNLGDKSAPLISQGLSVQNKSEKKSSVLIADESKNRTNTEVSEFRPSESSSSSGLSKYENNPATPVPVVAQQPAQATTIVANQFVPVASIRWQESNKVESKSRATANVDNLDSSPATLSALAKSEVYPDEYPGAAQLLQQLTQAAVRDTTALVSALETAKRSHLQAIRDKEAKN